jgi:hypothetical protein
MNRFFFWLGCVGIVGLPLGFAYVLERDLAHPENWADPMYDPRLYGTGAVILVIVGLLMFLHILWTHRRKQ